MDVVSIEYFIYNVNSNNLVSQIPFAEIKSEFEIVALSSFFLSKFYFGCQVTTLTPKQEVREKRKLNYNVTKTKSQQ